MDPTLRQCSRMFLSLFVTCFAPAGVLTAKSPPGRYPRCKAEQLSFSTDDENGAFNGMSHSGTLLVLRNVGPDACELPAIPDLTFSEGTHQLEVKREPLMPRFVHPGPVVLPVAVAPGAEVTTTLRWISGEVFADSVCVLTTGLAVEINGKMLHTSLGGHLCGDHAKGIYYQQGRLAPDPTVEH